MHRPQAGSIWSFWPITRTRSAHLLAGAWRHSGRRRRVSRPCASFWCRPRGRPGRAAYCSESRQLGTACFCSARSIYALAGGMDQGREFPVEVPELGLAGTGGGGSLGSPIQGSLVGVTPLPVDRSDGCSNQNTKSTKQRSTNP